MDVRCERCQTEYEIEDAQLGDLGIEVQCGDCGHLFKVKRQPASPAPVGGPPASGDAAGGGPWQLVTSLGQTLDVHDPTLLERWIIEGRVSREDRLTRDGQSWQPLGSLAELAPYFEIVDNAQRARGVQGQTPAAPLIPLQPPILTPPGGVAKLASPGALGGGPADSLGAVPRVASIGDTDAISAAPAGARIWQKIAIMVLVASGVGYGGIVWQKHYLCPAVVSSSGIAPDLQAPATPPPRSLEPVAPPAAPPAIPAPVADEESAENSADQTRGPVIEPLDSFGAGQGPMSLAAQGYVALGQNEYLEAIALFRRELAQSPINGTALFGLAEAYRGAGKTQQALKAYRRYLAMLPFGPNAGSARFQIRTLEARKR
jgi:predicted Zn finger-like uncharacterized protein